MLFTGERAHGKGFMGEKRFRDHFIRYDFAKKFAEGKTVLDIACGSGYGTNILSEVAGKIVGMDVSKETIDFNNSNYKLKNGEFVWYDGSNNPYEDNFFDLIVSYETIEHIVEYETFLKELKRILKVDGTLIISTPNFLGEIWKNKYHVSNFTHKDFLNTVSRFFDIEKVLFQGKHYYPFPGRGIVESILGIKKDYEIYEEKPSFDHHVSILICKKK